MKKTLLSTLLSETSEMSREEVKYFYEKAEPNPFLNAKKKRTAGLDKMVRDIDDLDDYDQDIDWEDAKISDYDDDELRYIAPHRMKNYKRNEFNHPDDVEDIDLDAADEFMRNLEPEEDYGDEEEFKLFADSEIPYDPFDDQDDLDDDEFDKLMNDDDEDPTDDEFSELDPDAETGDNKYQGIIRSVKGAYLVSKTQQPDETFAEVWVYNVGDKYDDEANIRKAILSATDIDPTKGFSEDGSQESFTKTVGNVQFLNVNGLPN